MSKYIESILNLSNLKIVDDMSLSFEARNTLKVDIEYIIYDFYKKLIYYHEGRNFNIYLNDETIEIFFNRCTHWLEHAKKYDNNEVIEVLSFILYSYKIFLENLEKVESHKKRCNVLLNDIYIMFMKKEGFTIVEIY